MMDEEAGDNKQQNNSQQSKKLMVRMASMSLIAGCLTFIVAGGALLVGLLIDIRQETIPRWTLIFLVGSMPFTLGGLFLIVRYQIKKIRNERSSKDQES